MKKVIFLIIVVLLVSSALGEVNKAYEIDLQYNRGNITLNFISVVPFTQGIIFEGGDYLAELEDFEGKLVSVVAFDFTLNQYYDELDPETGQIIGGGMVELNEAEVTLYVPYHKDAKEINVYINNTLKLTIPVVRFSKEVSTITEEELLEDKDIKEEAKNKEIKPKGETIPFWKWVAGIVGLLILILITGIIFAVIRKPKL